MEFAAMFGYVIMIFIPAFVVGAFLFWWAWKRFKALQAEVGDRPTYPVLQEYLQEYFAQKSDLSKYAPLPLPGEEYALKSDIPATSGDHHAERKALMKLVQFMEVIHEIANEDPDHYVNEIRRLRKALEAAEQATEEQEKLSKAIQSRTKAKRDLLLLEAHEKDYPEVVPPEKVEELERGLASLPTRDRMQAKVAFEEKGWPEQRREFFNKLEAAKTAVEQAEDAVRQAERDLEGARNLDKARHLREAIEKLEKEQEQTNKLDALLAEARQLLNSPALASLPPAPPNPPTVKPPAPPNLPGPPPVPQRISTPTPPGKVARVTHAGPPSSPPLSQPLAAEPEDGPDSVQQVDDSDFLPPDPEPPKPTKRCSRCNTEVQAEGNFCPICGSPLEVNMSVALPGLGTR